MPDERSQSYVSLCRAGRELLRERDSQYGYGHIPGVPWTDKPFTEWDESVAEWLDEWLPDSGFSAAWSILPRPPYPVDCGGSDAGYWDCFDAAVRERLNWLAQLAPRMPPVAQVQAEGSTAPVTPLRRIFVVHGHNEAARETVARFLERVGFEPVILHEQPNKGRTIIEKFESYADVGFAVVLLTADDVGGRDSVEGASLKARARQNVILELGYFLGKLGRARLRPLGGRRGNALRLRRCPVRRARHGRGLENVAGQGTARRGALGEPEHALSCHCLNPGNLPTPYSFP